MKVELRFLVLQSLIVEADTVAEAVAKAVPEAKRLGYKLLAAGTPEDLAKLDGNGDEETPKLPPRATPPSGTPGCPTVTVIAPPVDAIARAA